MATEIHIAEDTASSLVGLRMTAEEFLALPETKDRYELIDGVVFMSPGATPRHQFIVAEVFGQLRTYLVANPIGVVLADVEVRLGSVAGGEEIVYRPDIVFVERRHLPGSSERLRATPSLVVEVLSPATRNLDRRTKREDYERFGVQEYWLVDPDRKEFTFYRLEKGKYVEAAPQGDSFVSQAVPGFALDLTGVRKTFEPW
ncbi:MAG: Uma2 family endonuclease [Planctomycetes bacterium]|nr:Uma2 family endonuclease [Planctomycetota bacterium]